MTHPCAPQPCAPQPTCSSPTPQPCAPHEVYCQSQHGDQSCGNSGCDGGHPSASISLDVDVHVALDCGHDFCHA
jgi:hypothetical protein